ncbi:type II toxin-antitoxin system ParD family antitoxin [Floridanema aerugineum]|uniref:Type II toxin-antitoxin system ParD family antitoxin n=1 Tax=Floridaenema aerugineum BLCC-F46 TaxID=3153654 RepID=A0ABV4X433_9CYAN
MSINLTLDQERFIQSKLQAGKYRSAEEVIEIALRLFDEYDRAEAEWIGTLTAEVNDIGENHDRYIGSALHIKIDEYDRAEAEWIDNVREKIDAAIAISEHTPPIDGETFINQILDRFQQEHQAQE